MPYAVNLIALMLDAILALVNIVVSVVVGYAAALTATGLAALVVLAAIVGVFAVLRSARR